MNNLAPPGEAERSSEEKTADRVAFAGNGEAKCVLQLLVEPGEEVTTRVINARFANAQSPKGAIKPKARNGLSQKLADSLVPAGQFEIQSGRTQWVAKKSDDSDVGDALAGHMLGLSEYADLSLLGILGKTAKTHADGHRAPFYRLRVFSALGDLGPEDHISAVALAQQLGFSRSTLHSHIESMADSGLLDYYAEPPEGHQANYTILKLPAPEEGRQSYAHLPLLRKRLVDFIHDRLANGKTELNYPAFCAYLGRADERPPDKTNVHRLFRRLVRQRVLLPAFLNVHAGDEFSMIAPREDRTQLVARINNIFAGLVSQSAEFIETGQAHARRIMDDKELIGRLLRKEWDASPEAKKQPRASTALQIEELLATIGETSTAQLRLLVDDGRLSRDGLAGILREMAKAGRVVPRRIGNHVLWGLTSEAS